MSREDDATRREAAGDGTRREGSQEGTRREGSTAGSRVNLPAELSEYRIVEQIGAGGEGFVLLVESAAGIPFVAKLYRPGLTFDPRPTQLLALAHEDHVVKIIRSGTASDDGSRFEVLEWCPHGSLRDLLDSGRRVDPIAVIREVSTALEHVHSLRLPNDPDARLVHQDVKPENLLVKSLDPLNLVLGDFGLARMIEGSRHLTNRQEGSRLWAPPSGEAITPGWDWWSLGMLVATLAGGKHPFMVDGRYLPDAAISDLLSQGPVDLSAVEDPRLLMVCRGLLTRRTADRWGADEVRQWLNGGSPRVSQDLGRDPSRVRLVRFADQEYDDPVQLALAFQREWDEAQERVAQRTDQGLVADVRALLAAYGMTEAIAILDDPRSPPPVILCKLLIEMNPHLPPLAQGVDVRPGAILQRLADPRRSGEEVGRIRDNRRGYLATGVLAMWRHLEGMAGAPDLEEGFRDVDRFLAQQEQRKVMEQVPSGQRDAVVAGLLAGAAHDLETIRGALGAVTTPEAMRQDWWRSLAARSNDRLALALARLTQPIAQEQSVREDRATAERREQQRREEQAAAERRAREQRERETQERHTRVDRLWRTDRRFLKWWGVLSLTIAPAAGLGYLVVRGDFPANGLEDDLEALADAKWHLVAAFLWIVGFAALAGLTGLILLLRARWGQRRRGAIIGAVLLAAATPALLVRGSIENSVLSSARNAFWSTPIPLDRIAELCESYTYWTGTSAPTRKVVAGDSCNFVAAFDGWQWRWSTPVAGTRIDTFSSIDGTLITTSATELTEYLQGISGSNGSVLWTKSCVEGWELDLSQRDAGLDSPSEQRLGAACGDEDVRWIDPRTGT